MQREGSSNVQDAHEAIRPTQPEVKTLSDADADQQSLYRLIWGRFAGVKCRILFGKGGIW